MTEKPTPRARRTQQQQQQPGEHAPREHHSHHTREKEARSRRNGWIAFGGLTVFLLVLVLVVLKQNSDAAAKEKKIADDSAALVAEIRKLDLGKEDDARTALKRIAESADKELTSDAALSVKQSGDAAKNTLHRVESQKAVQAVMDEVAAALAGTGPALDAEGLKALQKKRASVEAKAHEAGKEWADKWAASHKSLDQGAATMLVTRARSEITAGHPVAAIALFDKAEEELASLLETAKKGKDTEVVNACTKQNQEIVKESDTLAVATFTADAIAKAPARSLTDATSVPLWKPARDSALKFNVTPQALELEQAAGGKGGMISLVEKEPWRNFRLSFDASVEKGSAVLLFRVREHADRKQCASITLGEGQDVAPTVGSPIHVEIDMIGSTMTIRSGADHAEKTVDARGKSRRGVLSIMVAADSKLSLANLAVRNLD